MMREYVGKNERGVVLQPRRQIRELHDREIENDDLEILHELLDKQADMHS